MQALLLLADNNSDWKVVDTWFFVICALIVVAIVAIYYLIPVFNKKKYQEQRDNLAKREAAFKANRQQNTTQDTNKTQAANVAAEVDSQQNKDADV